MRPAEGSMEGEVHWTIDRIRQVTMRILTSEASTAQYLKRYISNLKGILIYAGMVAAEDGTKTALDMETVIRNKLTDLYLKYSTETPVAKKLRTEPSFRPTKKQTSKLWE